MMREIFFLLLLFTTPAWAGPENWPPVVNKEFTNIKMIDANGKDVELKSLKGKVLLIEPIGMTCAGCQAFSGGHKFGAFGSVSPQTGLKSIEEYLPEWGNGVSLTDPRLQFVQIIFYNQALKPPTAQDVAAWKKHFKMDRSSNMFVFGAKAEYVDGYARGIIPGFFLVDKQFKLLSEATGSNPKTNLYTEFMPRVKKALD